MFVLETLDNVACYLDHLKEYHTHYSNQWRLPNDTNNNYSTMQTAKNSSTHNYNIKFNIMFIISLLEVIPSMKDSYEL